MATQHDSLYAIDANTGAILWHDSFLDITNPTNLTPTTGVTTVPAAAMNGSSAGPELGILATPTIDASTNELFLNAATTEVRSANTHYVQRLWAVNIGSGKAVASTVIGDTIFNGTKFGSYAGYQYVAGAIVNGTGNNKPGGANATYPDTDGWASAPGGATGYVIAVNALQQMERTAVTLINGTVYLGFASHGDDGPYYGWVLGYGRTANLLPQAGVRDYADLRRDRGRSRSIHGSRRHLDVCRRHHDRWDEFISGDRQCTSVQSRARELFQRAGIPDRQ